MLKHRGPEEDDLHNATFWHKYVWSKKTKYHLWIPGIRPNLGVRLVRKKTVAHSEHLDNNRHGHGSERVGPLKFTDGTCRSHGAVGCPPVAARHRVGRHEKEPCGRTAGPVMKRDAVK